MKVKLCEKEFYMAVSIPLVIGILMLFIGLLSGCIETLPEYHTHILYGYLEDWNFHNDTDVGGFILIIENASLDIGFPTDEKEHWFSSIKYSPIEMDYFIGHNISIRYESNYFEGWYYNYAWTTLVKEIKNLDVR